MPSELIICDDIWVDCNKQADGSAGSAVSRHCYRKSCLRRRCKKAVTSVHFGYELEQIVRVTIVVVNKQRFERHADQGCSRSPRSSGGGGGVKRRATNDDDFVRAKAPGYTVVVRRLLGF